MDEARALRVCSFAAVGLVVGMVALFVATGVGQDPLQAVHPPDVYAALLLRGPTALRATLALDNGFLVLYTAAFVLLALRLGTPLARLAGALLLAVGVLDLLENVHFLAMLAAAEQGQPPGSTEIGLQVVESLVKFHVSYLGLFLLSLALPRETLPQRLLADLGLYLQLPVGVLVYVTPPAIAVPLVFVRFTYFVVGLALVGRTFGR